MTDLVLVIGNGAREHALAWKLSKSPSVKHVYVSPGNAGTDTKGNISNCVINVSSHADVASWCKNKNISLVVVGPEAYLANGLADHLTSVGIKCFGPCQKAAEIEASKEFAKDFMDRYNIPTARWKSFRTAKEAQEHISSAPYDALVVKASGLAAGKGVIVGKNKEEAIQAVNALKQDKALSSASDVIVIEELLTGEEVSVLCFSDGTNVEVMPPAQDHKRLLNNDKGPNTGGMGAYCRCPLVSEADLEYIKENALVKAINGMKAQGSPYIGVLYAGLMLTKDGPKVLEYNCRFGDPETQDPKGAPKSERNKKFTKKISTGEQYDFFYYLPSLKNCKTVTEKMKSLYSLSSFTEKEISDRNFIREKVLKTLRPFYPHCQVFIYGSTVNGFGTKGSDLDLLFLPFPEYCKLGGENEEEEPPSRDQVQSGGLSPIQLEMMGEKAHLRFIFRIFKRVFPRTAIIKAKCPILNFIAFDKRSKKIICDLSCRNKLVVYNTELLSFFTRIDSRVVPLVITLRFWAKAMEFIKSSALSSYAFTLLVIFFLQNTSPPVLPTVDFLMEKTEDSCSVAGYEVSFSDDLTATPQYGNQESEGELLQKFFSFYWDFDFTRNIVCVRTGKALPIKDMLNSNINENTNSKTKEFQISAICIQDPFNLSHNVGKNMKDKSVAIFKPLMLIASRILTTNANDECMFEKLFDRTMLTKQVDSEFYFQDPKTFTFLISLDHDMIAILGDGEDLLERFYDQVPKAIFDILSYGFLMDCEITDMTSFASLDRNIDRKETDIGRDSNCLMSIQGSVYDRIWVTREKVQIDDEELASDALEMEHAISIYLRDSNPECACPTQLFFFLCRCYKTDYPQIPYLIIELSQLTKSKEFRAVQVFLMSSLPRIVKDILLKNECVS